MPMIRDAEGKAGWKNPGKSEVKAEPEKKKEESEEKTEEPVAEESQPRRRGRPKKTDEEY